MKSYPLTVLLLLTLNFAFGQSYDEVEEEELKEIIQIRKELERNHQIKESYKIQVFSGNLEEAKKVKKEFDNNKDFVWDSKMIFETPNYKVWVGHYRNRLEADRALKVIIEEFDNALILKPGRS